MPQNTKLQWERLAGGFDLVCINPNLLDKDKAMNLLVRVTSDHGDYAKSFNKRAVSLWENWINNPIQPLAEAAYCLLSNWFLTECSASKTMRAGYARELWQLLFSALPDKRLTNWKISGEKVISEEFDLWWDKQSMETR